MHFFACLLTREIFIKCTTFFDTYFSIDRFSAGYCTRRSLLPDNIPATRCVSDLRQCGGSAGLSNADNRNKGQRGSDDCKNTAPGGTATFRCGDYEHIGSHPFKTALYDYAAVLQRGRLFCCDISISQKRGLCRIFQKKNKFLFSGVAFYI